MDDEKNLTLIIVVLIVLSVILLGLGIYYWTHDYRGLGKILIWVGAAHGLAGLVTIGVEIARRKRR